MWNTKHLVAETNYGWISLHSNRNDRVDADHFKISNHLFLAENLLLKSLFWFNTVMFGILMEIMDMARKIMRERVNLLVTKITMKTWWWWWWSWWWWRSWSSSWLRNGELVTCPSEMCGWEVSGLGRFVGWEHTGNLDWNTV